MNKNEIFNKLMETGSKPVTAETEREWTELCKFYRKALEQEQK